MLLAQRCVIIKKCHVNNQFIHRDYYLAQLSTVMTTPSVASTSMFQLPASSQSSLPTDSGKESDDDFPYDL